MSILSKYLGTEGLKYPEDIEKLQEEIPELRLLPPKLVEQMYRDFSERYSASWLSVDESYLESFKNWIRS